MDFLSFQPYMVTIIVILSLNIFATIAILKNSDKGELTKPMQLAGVWFIPLFSAIGILLYYYGGQPNMTKQARKLGSY